MRAGRQGNRTLRLVTPRCWSLPRVKPIECKCLRDWAQSPNALQIVTIPVKSNDLLVAETLFYFLTAGIVNFKRKWGRSQFLQ